MEAEIRLAFGLSKNDPNSYSPLALAYIGDGVYELVIRTVLISRGNIPAKKLHRMSIDYVSARAQSRLLESIYSDLSEEELAVYTRGRNAKPKSPAKSASLAEYHAATGLEALIGYLYLQNRYERIFDLIKQGIDGIAVR